MSLRRPTKTQIDQAIADGAQPSIPRNGLGLVLKHGRRRTGLLDAAGNLSAAGTYYYRTTNQEPPRSFDYNQTPERTGRSLTIRVLDGSRRTVQRFDPVKKEFVPTILGKRFFGRRTDRITVMFPVFVDITRTNGSVYSRQDWMPSTATDLGELQISAALSTADQEREVKRLARAWMDAQPSMEGERILLAGYETHRHDPSRPLQYNKLSHNVAAEPEAAMHRPLTASTPWSFGFQGICEEATHDTDGQCVPHQLAKCIHLKGGDSPFTEAQILEELYNASLELYEDDDPELLECPGFTAAAIRRVCESFQIPFTVCHGLRKLDSYTPMTTKYENLVCHVWADHLYCVAEPAAARTVVAQLAKAADAPLLWCLAPIQRRPRRGADVSSWELFTSMSPGDFYTKDIDETRAKLHAQSICPTVQKDGMNRVKALRYNDCVIHSLPREADVCQKFLQEMGKTRAHAVQYRAETFASFGQLIFDSLCTVDARDPPTYLQRQSILARCQGKCEGCGDALDGSFECDHHVPRSAFGKDSAGNLRCLCPGCHKLKTVGCDAKRINVEDVNPYYSRFSQETWNAFVCSRRPTQVVADLHKELDGPIYHCDIKSCRYNALVECNSHDIPVFSPLDEVAPVTAYHLSDYMWCEVPSQRLRSQLATIAYDGPRWYSKAECEFLLEHGIAQWEDFKLSLQATSRRPAKEL